MRAVCPTFLVFFYVICRLTDRPLTKGRRGMPRGRPRGIPRRLLWPAQLHMPSRGSHQLQPVYAVVWRLAPRRFWPMWTWSRWAMVSLVVGQAP